MPGGAHRKTCKRYDVEGHAHYLTFSCFQRRPFFNRDTSRRWFLAAVEAARVKEPFDLWAYIIMPEHIHMLLLPHSGSRVRVILQAIKQPVAQKAVRWARKHEPDFLESMRYTYPNGRSSCRFWLPGGGYDRNVWTETEIHEKVNYIHDNPVRRGLVTRAEDWPWSSARAWVEGVHEPIRVDMDTVPPATL